MPTVLNIGAGGIPVPHEYRGWRVVTLDLDPQTEPDLCMDARDLRQLAAGQYDAVYASHILEHVYPHEVDAVLWGCYHVLHEAGFLHVRVPDALGVMQSVVRMGWDLDAMLYQSSGGPIHVYDVVWGWRVEVEAGGADYYTHKTGFSRKALGQALKAARFEYVEIGSSGYELRAYAYKRRPE